MADSYWYKPAFYAHLLSSLAMLTAIVLFVTNYRKILQLDALELIKICSLLAIAIASHADGHVTLEKEYGYDPVGALRA
jgi:hypothetical protein